MSNADDEPPEPIWRTAIGRSDFAFRSMLYSDDGPFFLSVEHLKAIVEHRRRAGRAAAIFLFAAIAISFVILLKSSALTLDIQTPGGTIRNIPISTTVLLFALSVTTAYYVISFLNHVLLNKQIYAIFEHAGLQQNEAMSRAAHAVARWSAEELWIDVLNLRPLGFRSGVSHWTLVLVTLLFMIAIGISQITIILLAAYGGLEQARSANALTYYFVALPSFVAVHVAIVGFFVAWCVPMKFKWNPAQTIEAVPHAEDPSAVQGGAASDDPSTPAPPHTAT